MSRYSRRRPREMDAVRPQTEYEAVAGALPCPFCDASVGFDPSDPGRMDLAIFPPEGNEGEGQWWVTCTVCAAIGPSADSAELAVAKWNRARRPLVEAVLALTLDDEGDDDD